ncbi:C25 family cysteine peptidase [Dyadobacter chenwenxiniae]|uniref:C25 family cysteine peptidase n=1 Tax=Dyadobacter chenwenxiniae TaxID=2906456 RepID=A0A9X1PHI1_9BACT|nr:C25 family cysteine peptidase [Dyadobacter chenwenxiniae]MCF0061417.1 C25 family cysteine peptidase [Dyadobacter chenwenxiniae]UON81238.1 C25 family cysteine peptidase [Dyadobacter chenwenxiniae]
MMIRHTLYFLFSISLTLFCISEGSAQSAAPYANSWINYEQPYVKIAVNAKGMHKVPFSVLPATFPVNQPEKLQLWHLGKQVAIIVENKEILFYGVPNTGESDSLLYRPMSSRLNPFYSIYSDESAYFLTVSASKSLRAETVSRAVNEATPALGYHIAKASTVLSTDYSLGANSPLRPNFFNSFFEKGASRTGPNILKNVQSTYPIQLTNAVSNSVRPKVKLLVHGRSNNERKVEVYIGKTEQTLRLAKVLPSSNFEGVEGEFEIEKTDLDNNFKGIIALKSVSTDQYERFSLAYFTVSYPQNFSIASKKSIELTLDPQASALSRVATTGAPAGAKIYDITDTLRVIAGNVGNFMVPRKSGKVSKLLVTNEIITVPAAKVSAVKFQRFDPKVANYIIVSGENLLAGSTEYAAYRASQTGGGFKTVVANIKDVYNQFNYGEPSPLGIRRFASYMISDGVRDKSLFLIGKSISLTERMKKELPDEVPTIGFPASDILLVEGLGGVSRDVPALNVGRLPAMTDQNIKDYLEKVKEYELNDGQELGWRKQILHLNGGKSASEITQLKNVLETLKPAVENGFVGGRVTPFVKQQAISEVEKVNITPQVNEGVGMITYFGHGSATVTDLDMGYITDADRGYNNNGKYPFMFFNGCGVGNVFAARYNTSPTATDRRPLSMDWILTPKKGTVALVANSFESYISSSSRYLSNLYNTMFAEEATSSASIGRVQAVVAQKIVSAGANQYDIANIHQSLLQGDPAVKVVTVSKPDYAVGADDAVVLYSESAGKTIDNSASVRAVIKLANEGRYIKDQKVPVQVEIQYNDGKSEVKNETIAAMAYKDTLSLSFVNQKNIKRILFKIDPANTLQELSKRNNNSELIVDWDVAKALNFYPSAPLKDLIAPILEVKFDGRIIENNDAVDPGTSISIKLEDDRILSPDTSLVNVFIKPCEGSDCDFAKLSYASNDLKISSLSERSINVTYQAQGLKPGTYELLVNAKDASSNASTNPYRIVFKIKEEDQENQLTVSPNPASSYIRFRLEAGSTDTDQSVHWTMYSLKGAALEEGGFQLENSGIKDWYWIPAPHIPSGTYIYKLNLKAGDKTRKSFTGRVVILK